MSTSTASMGSLPIEDPAFDPIARDVEPHPPEGVDLDVGSRWLIVDEIGDPICSSDARGQVATRFQVVATHREHRTDTSRDHSSQDHCISADGFGIDQAMAHRAPPAGGPRLGAAEQLGSPQSIDEGTLEI